MSAFYLERKKQAQKQKNKQFANRLRIKKIDIRP